jgi:outer membrane cobalamin receptor
MGISNLSFLLTLGATSAFAVSPAVEAPPSPTQAEATVTVTAEATPVPVVKTPNPVLVIDKAAIEARGTDNLGDLLQSLLPGQVHFAGGAGALSSISLGGARPQDTVVTLDGMRLADSSGLGGVNLSLISLAGIDRIEVQQGPCSTRFGSDAQAGVVALYSAGRAPEGFSGQVLAGAGNMDIRESAFASAYGWNSGWVRASVSAKQEAGPTEADNNYRSIGTSLGLGQQLGADTLLTVNYLNTFSGVPLPIIYVNYPPQAQTASQYDPARQDLNRTQVVDATLRSSLAQGLTGELTLGQVLQNRLEPDFMTNAPTDAYLSRRNQALGSLTWKATAATTLQGGFEAYEETASSVSGFGTPDAATGRHLAVYVEDQFEATRDLRFVASVRDERDRLTFPTAQNGYQDDAIDHATWKLGINALLGGGFRVFASAGTAFSNPILFQTIWNAQYQGQTLNNEKSTTYQTGLTYEAGAWKAGLVLSRTLYDSLIAYNPYLGPVIDSYGDQSGVYQNGANLRLQSAQFTLGYSVSAWSLEGFYRNQEFQDEQAPAGLALQTSSVVERPFQSLGLSGHRTFGQLRVEARWAWTGGSYQYGYPDFAFKEHFNDLSLLAAWRLRKDLTLTLRGDHLMQPRTSYAQWLSGAQAFQNDASQIYGYPAQPPTVTLEARYKF